MHAEEMYMRKRQEDKGEKKATEVCPVEIQLTMRVYTSKPRESKQRRC